VTYAIFVENMDTEKREEFDAMLAGEVPVKAAAPKPQSKNVSALMSTFGMAPKE
jgi:hypothetical protein